MTSEHIQNGRTHEPSLREAVIQLDDLKELVKSEIAALTKLIDERDRLYGERAEAQVKALEAALHASEHQTASSFAASEKAILKAEIAQQQYNERSNEFRAALDDAQKTMIGRAEAKSEFDRVGERIADIKKEMTTIRAQATSELTVYREATAREISDLREWRSQNVGKAQGVSGTWYVVSAVFGVVSWLIGAAMGAVFHVLK